MEVRALLEQKIVEEINKYEKLLNSWSVEFQEAIKQKQNNE